MATLIETAGSAPRMSRMVYPAFEAEHGAPAIRRRLARVAGFWRSGVEVGQRLSRFKTRYAEMVAERLDGHWC